MSLSEESVFCSEFLNSLCKVEWCSPTFGRLHVHNSKYNAGVRFCRLRVRFGITYFGIAAVWGRNETLRNFRRLSPDNTPQPFLRIYES